MRESLITPPQLQQALRAQRTSGGRLGGELSRLGYIEEQALTAFLASQYGVPSINLADFDIDPDVLKLLPREVVTRHQIVPVNQTGDTIIIAMVDPSNIYAIDDVKFITGHKVEVVVTSEQNVADAVERYYSGSVSFSDVMMDLSADEDFDEDDTGDLFDAISDDDHVLAPAPAPDGDGINVLDLETSASDAPIIKLVQLILLDTLRKNATEVLIEPAEKHLTVRYRIDGALSDVMKAAAQAEAGHLVSDQDHERPRRWRHPRGPGGLSVGAGGPTAAPLPGPHLAGTLGNDRAALCRRTAARLAGPDHPGRAAAAATSGRQLVAGS